jgi:hypothetical protein
MTKQRLLTLARKLYGKHAFVEERPKALDAAGREALTARRKELVLKRDTLKSALGNPALATKRLLEAATFVCDVDGDDPSIPQLREAVAVMQATIAAQQEYAEVMAELRDTAGRGYSRRWAVLKVLGDTPFPCSTSVAEGDTIEECAAKLQEKALAPNL